MARVPAPLPANAAREDAILSLMPLANKMAKFLSYKTRKEFGDLLGDAYVGAIYAVDHFDKSRGSKLTTYAVPIIYGFVMKGICARDPWPTRVRDLLRQVDRSLAALESQLGRPATEEDIEARFPGYGAARKKAHMWSVASIDAFAADARDVAFEDMNLSARVEAEEQRELLASMLAQLAPRQREAISEHYFNEKTFRQISEDKQLSVQAVQQAHARGLRRLREMPESAKLIAH